ncbi:hypothetical protein H5407_06545 [Mitsuaria sp. WAJ17]|uniref:hypothetical protein n=1 Tax=Mitsuaria sp. WAJ17 TaxID=2761452 RepID=UPI0016024052|nr:hypothetical protein [Mitsuaria sp. WAJ17]MBB2484884.1 hypothetical protein [Mitsuaria sp. WAJ17]
MLLGLGQRTLTLGEGGSSHQREPASLSFRVLQPASAGAGAAVSPATASGELPTPAAPVAPQAVKGGPPLAATSEPAEVPVVQLAGFNLQDYLPRRAVDEGPRVQGQVSLPWPEGFPGRQLHKGRFRVYIDEHGRVRRVAAEALEMASPFVELTQQAFLQAHFEPGKLAGQSVRTWILIEVVYEDSGVVFTQVLSEQ